MTNMKPPLLLFIFISVSLEALPVSVTGDNVGAYHPTDDIAVDCGSNTSSPVENRNWIGDAADRSDYFPIEKTHSSTTSEASSSSPSIPGAVPYLTARLSRSEFAYTFDVTAGPKFVRLHFFPSDYPNFRRVDSFFSVEAAGYTLLRNFSASLFADYTRSTSFFSKEFCLSVGEDQILNITFTPTPGNSDAYAFVNGIEVVSMPESLYYNTVVDSTEGIKLAGQLAPYTLDTTKALEAVKGLNVGGQFVGPARDTGMYRTWEADDEYVTSSDIGVLPVNTIFQLNYEINEPLDRVFEIFIELQLVEDRADVISWSGKGVPVYRDFAEALYDSQKKRTNLSVALGALPDGSTLYSDAILNGLEIFKINNSDGNLAGLNPDPVPNKLPGPPPASKAPSSPSKADSTSRDGTSRWGPLSYATTKSTKTQGALLPSDLCRHFSLKEIRAATNNFDKGFIIGVGGFGNRLNQGSQQGLHEFRTEIEMLSQLRHLHLVSLIGFCKDAGEMILVYDYMARGTLSDHLYNTDNPPLPWKQRLEICIGAAWTSTAMTNILLNEKWVAKVSDFGLSKVGPTSESKTHVSTAVKSTFGYLDPEYYRRQRLTDKSDVYSFGVVLFEVLCARPAVSRMAPMEQISLAEWAQSCCKSGSVEEMVDPHLKGAIALECLNKFCEIAMSCLRDEGTKRPSMNDVVDDDDHDAASIRGNGSDEEINTSDSDSGGRKSSGEAATSTRARSNDVCDESSYVAERLP
ncbi:hypothetical protein EUGRSUZ_J01489 [Eucalyptus grandis]|uniref:Uncharacterized protein n=2 Tax=Eucalyptus grandis TaxID=71139 RepID=A0ACC3J6K4_EUCGR|nr:hypothetical protein EUGRSUZ_J01489 [Eucalyptus grandis]